MNRYQKKTTTELAREALKNIIKELSKNRLRNSMPLQTSARNILRVNGASNKRWKKFFDGIDDFHTDENYFKAIKVSKNDYVKWQHLYEGIHATIRQYCRETLQQEEGILSMTILVIHMEAGKKPSKNNLFEEIDNCATAHIFSEVILETMNFAGKLYREGSLKVSENSLFMS